MLVGCLKDVSKLFEGCLKDAWKCCDCGTRAGSLSLTNPPENSPEMEWHKNGTVALASFLLYFLYDVETPERPRKGPFIPGVSLVRIRSPVPAKTVQVAKLGRFLFVQIELKTLFFQITEPSYTFKTPVFCTKPAQDTWFCTSFLSIDKPFQASKRFISFTASCFFSSLAWTYRLAVVWISASPMIAWTVLMFV